jgi:hypothetical protein
MDFLKTAVHTAGQFRIFAGGSLLASGAPASTNGNATIDSGTTLTGDLQCQTKAGTGTVTGTTTLLAPSKAMPDSGVVAMYKALGTVISTGGTMSSLVLTPTYSTFGTPNADGVYVINTTNSITIKGIRLEGTLVISCPGQTVTIDQAVFMHNYRSDYPTLIVDGNLTLQITSATALSETTWSTNFNPSGAPYPYVGGTTNTTQTDTYPNEIQGLVHCRGVFTVNNSPRVRGAIICESATGSADVAIKGALEVDYVSTLYSSPPMGYAKAVTMSVQPGSWRQVVLP